MNGRKQRRPAAFRELASCKRRARTEGGSGSTRFVKAGCFVRTDRATPYGPTPFSSVKINQIWKRKKSSVGHSLNRSGTGVQTPCAQSRFVRTAYICNDNRGWPLLNQHEAHLSVMDISTSTPMLIWIWPRSAMHNMARKSKEMTGDRLRVPRWWGLFSCVLLALLWVLLCPY
jgi:hypothetical protein